MAKSKNDDGFRPTTARVTYQGWTLTKTSGGGWAATDGRYTAVGTPMIGAPTQAALQARIDAYITRTAG